MATAAGSVRSRLGRPSVAALGPAILGLVVFGGLAAFVGLDPAPGVTASASPFTDEAYNVLEPRNLVLLGSWTTDDWALYLVHLPYSLLLAAVFAVFGVGIIQARLVSIALMALTTAWLAASLDRPLGRGPAYVAASAYAGCALVLYYGRLAFLEDLVVAGLVIGFVSLALEGGAPNRAGLVSGAALAIAIGTKPTAAFAVVGAMLGLVATGALGDRAARRRLLLASGVVALLGLLWVVVVALPNLAAIGRDVGSIWPQVKPPTNRRLLVNALTSFVRNPDGLTWLLGPLGLGAVVAVPVILARWRHLSGQARRLAAGAAGWSIVSLGMVAVFTYHPNRYAVPLVPGLAILVAVGVAAGLGWWHDRRARPTTGPAPGTVVARLAPAVLVLALVVPGLVTEAGWISATRPHLLDLQAAFGPVVPAGSVTVGRAAPALLMTNRVTTIVPWSSTVNGGDLYALDGARWYLMPRGVEPADLTLHPLAWAARREVVCGTWNAADLCLYEVP